MQSHCGKWKAETPSGLQASTSGRMHHLLNPARCCSHGVRVHRGFACSASADAASAAEGPSSGAPGLASFSGHQSRPGLVTFRASGSEGLSTGAARPQGKLGEITAKLQSLGLAGVVSYGLLNTLYYTASFLLVWTLVAKVPKGGGAAAAVKSFLGVFATVWAGSQVTKLARAGGALFLAPIVDKAMDLLCDKMKLQNKRQAFLIIVLSCIGLALAIFGIVVAAWA